MKCASAILTRCPALLALSLLASCTSSSHYLQQGNRALAAGLNDDAAIEFRNAIQKDARNGDAFYGLGLAEQRRGNTVQSIRAMTAARDLLPNREDIRIQLSNVEMAAYLASPAHPARLYDDLQKTAALYLAKDPKSYEGLRIKALLAWTDGKLREAIDMFEAADRTRPGQAELMASWCQALFDDGQFEEGERRALAMIRSQPQYGTIYDELAGAYYARNQRAEALHVIQTKAANSPERIADAIQLASWYNGYGKKEEMKADLDHLIATPETFPNAELSVGDFYFQLQNWQEAIRLYEDGAAHSRRLRITYLKRLCDTYLAQGNTSAAARDLDEILKANPKDDVARVVNDSLSVSTGQPVKAAAALKDLGDVVHRNPDKPVWRLTYADARLKTGDVDGAAQEFEETLRSRPDLLQARVALAQIAQEKGDDRKTLTYANEIIAVRPDLAEARFLRIAGLIGTKQTRVARLELEAIAQQNPGNPEVQFQMASLDATESKFGEAELLLEGLRKNPATRLRALKGLVAVYGTQNHLEKAYTMISEELARDPDSEPLRATAAELALRSGKYDDAVRLYRDLISRYPQSAAYRKLLGAAFQVNRNMPEAIANYEKAAELAPKDPSILLMLADGLRMAGRRDDAIAEYRRVLAVAPDNALAMNSLAFLLADSGSHLDEATKLIESALRQTPDSDAFKDTLGFVYVKKNQGASGVQVLRTLARKYPEAPTIHYHLALALSATGQKEQAHVELEAALSKGAAGEVRDQILQSLGRKK